ncbi:predicted protein [Sclerotinia sclerotiorum 1980 UF-70]|uniref:Uncharacterized protein n=1 Tax=Sclerotinia sclerotiorum (strain ATCC 18683 / 1980 / Ss-1) TaxID=665079 RepID=A7EHK1_SCLS1|nr:predicted protein [Sclerotinia sclerotiorum 1980 UF-70]EDO02317.1 predicted protein [Sclerotinia sclerotiorum 1980 UF-70]
MYDVDSLVLYDFAGVESQATIVACGVKLWLDKVRWGTLPLAGKYGMKGNFKKHGAIGGENQTTPIQNSRTDTIRLADQ